MISFSLVSLSLCDSKYNSEIESARQSLCLAYFANFLFLFNSNYLVLLKVCRLLRHHVQLHQVGLHDAAHLRRLHRKYPRGERRSRVRPCWLLHRRRRVRLFYLSLQLGTPRTPTGSGSSPNKKARPLPLRPHRVPQHAKWRARACCP